MDWIIPSLDVGLLLTMGPNIGFSVTKSNAKFCHLKLMRHHIWPTQSFRTDINTPSSISSWFILSKGTHEPTGLSGIFRDRWVVAVMLVVLVRVVPVVR